MVSYFWLRVTVVYQSFRGSNVNRSLNLKNLSIAALSTLTLGLSSFQPAFAGTPDPRIKAALDAQEIKYELSKDGNYKVTLPVGSGRTQLVLINSAVSKLTNMEIREVTSVAYKGSGVFPPEMAVKLMKDSSNRTIGAWELLANDTTSLAVFNAKVPSDLPAKSLVETILRVAVVADTVEKDLTNGKDDF